MLNYAEAIFIIIAGDPQLNYSLEPSLFGAEVSAGLHTRPGLVGSGAGDSGLPLVVQQLDASLDAFAWAEDNKLNIAAALSSVGALLFRDFPLQSNGDFIRFSGAFSRQWLPYVDRASKRSPISGPVFTSTDTPPRFDIPLHNESSFTNRWPTTILFFCHTAADQGGRTPIVDVRKVYEQIDPAIKQRIEQDGVLYVRNFGQATGMDWRETFQVDSRDEFEAYCQESYIALEWLEEDRLRTYQLRPGVARHPKTGVKVWFNHALALHYTSLDPALQRAFLSQYGELGLPHNSYYADGAAFSADEMQHIRDVYQANTFYFDWQPGDLLVLENMLVGHGREPYSGDRQVVVAMADPMDWGDVDHSLTMPDVTRLHQALLNHGHDRYCSGQQELKSPAAGAKAEELENRFLALVAEELFLDSVSLDDVFIDIGGDSMAAAILIEALQEDTGVELPIEVFFTSNGLGHVFAMLKQV